MKGTQSLSVVVAIRARHSVKHFSERPVERADVEALLELAVQAPNHRMTEPWRFLVVGPEGRHALARVLGRRKSSKVTDPEAARLVREKVERNTMALPALVVVALQQSDNPEIREEDYAAGWMAVQNITLAAVARGLGTHIKTGAVMDDPELRSAWRIPDDQRVIAMLELGEPAGEPRATEREPASSRTTWLE